MPKFRFASLFAAAMLLPHDAFASVNVDALRGRADPDWPCAQRKVAELSVVSVWSGPDVGEALTQWRNHPEVAALVGEVVARRMPLDQAVAAITRFAENEEPESKAGRLTQLFAGIFQTLDGERSEIIAGIERYGRKQKEMADRIRRDMALAAGPAAGSAEVAADLQSRLLWETRIFNERRGALTFVCEVPTIIEQRLFELARAIGRELPN